MMRPLLLLSFLFLLLSSCRTKKSDRQVERSFYYWKSVLKIDSLEAKRMQDLNVQTIYIKFFDVDWLGTRPAPIARLEAGDKPLAPAIKIIPTVFITNECLAKMDSSGLEPLAADLSGLVKTIYDNLGRSRPFEELQLDCDWTVSTRDKYFALLKAIKSKTGVPLSATIRLHQVKYTSSSGIPPVDRGLLMCYNMGNLKNPGTRNSIIELAELKRYTEKLPDYPLPLDVALPLFSWKVLFRQNEYSGLIKDLPDSLLKPSFTTQNNQRFIFLKDTLLLGYDFKKGDLLRSEESSYEEVMAVARWISGRLKNTRMRVSLYHLDSLLLRKFSRNEMEDIYNSLR